MQILGLKKLILWVRNNCKLHCLSKVVMKPLLRLICPVSTEWVDENRVRITALGVVLLMGIYFLTGSALVPLLLAVDFFVRAFTRQNYSPLSYLAHLMVKLMGTRTVPIDKAPKVFAARIGFILISMTAVGALLGWTLLAFVSGSTLVFFAFLECGVNFCMGCWIYTLLVYPLIRKNRP